MTSLGTDFPFNLFIATLYTANDTGNPDKLLGRLALPY